MAGTAGKKLTTAGRTAVWIDKSLVRQAKEIAARKDQSISELIESLLRSPLSRKHERTFAETGNPIA